MKTFPDGTVLQSKTYKEQKYIVVRYMHSGPKKGNYILKPFEDIDNQDLFFSPLIKTHQYLREAPNDEL